MPSKTLDKELSMTDLKHKVEMIRSIENLQLSTDLITALDDVHQAKDVVEAVNSLQNLVEHWN